MAAATDMDVSKAQALFNANLFGVMRMVREFAPLIIAAEGKIVNNASFAGCIALPFHSVYAASKAALLSYGDSLRVELKPFGSVPCSSWLSSALNRNSGPACRSFR